MKQAVVIGASRGIGQSLAAALAADGWAVTATLRDPGAAELPDVVTVARADLADEASLTTLAAGIAGPVALLAVVGGVYGQDRAFADVDAAAWTRVMTVNALGPVLAARAFADKLTSDATVVALTSKMGSIADNDGGGAWSYRMSKTALNMGFANLALEWPHRAVAVLHPGWVRTAMGGASAPVGVEQSVAGLARVIAALKPTGRALFLDFEGKTIPW